MKPFTTLSEKENEKLLRFPAYIPLLAANQDGMFDEAEKWPMNRLLRSFTGFFIGRPRSSESSSKTGAE